MSEVVTIGDATLYHGDCLTVMRGMDADSVDSIVTDPPYHLTTGKKGGSGPASVNLESPYGRARITTGFMGKAWDGGDIAHDPEVWIEALRVAKPGAHLLAFGGTRTFHRLACAIEDAGWEIRDCVMWVHGQGFPKSLDVSKAIDKAAGAEREVIGTKRVTRILDAETLRRDNYTVGAIASGGDIDVTGPATDAARQWQGWGTALKPAWEPIIVARKKLIGTVAENVLKHGTGALNIDASRIESGGTHGSARSAGLGAGYEAHNKPDRKYGNGLGGIISAPNAIGRWPANLIHDGGDEVVALFPQSDGQAAAVGPQHGVKASINTFGDYGPRDQFEPRNDTDSAARFFYCAKASRSDRNDLCEGLPLKQSGMVSNTSGQHITRRDGGAPGPSSNHHPTVKPTALMRYLCRLVTPPGGIVFDPFAGSGSTGVAALADGFRFVGIELEHEYLNISRERLSNAQKQARMFA